MSPAPTAIRKQNGDRAVLLPYPTADLLARLAKEIVVDWQLPADRERKA